MEFLGVGYQELFLVLVLMLVVVGPKRLPEVAYHIGRAVRTLQGYARVVRDEFRDEFGYLDEEMKLIKGDLAVAEESLREVQDDVRELRSVETDVREATEPVKQDLKEGPLTAAPNGASRNGAGSAAKPADSAEEPATPPKPPLVF